MFHNARISAWATSIALFCTLTPAQATNTPDEPRLKVEYTREFPGGSVKAIPTAVTVVRRSTTQKVVNQRILTGVAIALITGGAGFAFETFSKDDLMGASITQVKDKANVANPVADAYISRLQRSLKLFLAADPELRDKTFKHPLLISGGEARLIYEDLSGTDEERFRLVTEIIVYKRRETANFLSPVKVVEMRCAASSPEPWPEARWAENDYAPLRDALGARLDDCEGKLMAELPRLLKD